MGINAAGYWFTLEYLEPPPSDLALREAWRHDRHRAVRVLSVGRDATNVRSAEIVVIPSTAIEFMDVCGGVFIANAGDIIAKVA